MMNNLLEWTNNSRYFIHAAIALCLYDKKYIPKYEKYLQGNAVEFIELISNTPGVLTKSMCLSKNITHMRILPQMMVEEVYNIFDDIKKMEEASVTILSNDVVKAMNDEKWLTDAFKIIDQARSKLATGQRNEGIRLLHSIGLHSDVKQRPMSNLLISSISQPTGFPSGIKKIDEDTGGWLAGNMAAIAGDSGSQKTMLSLWLCLKALMANPYYTCVYFEKEMPINDIMRRLVSHLLKIDGRELMKMSNQPHIHQENILNMVSQIRKVIGDVNNPIAHALNRFIPIEREMFRNAGHMAEIVEHYKANIWVLDFATTLEPSSGKIDDDAMRQEFTTIKAMLDRTQSFGIVLSQLKQSNGVDSRANKIPLIGDMEWGKHLRQFSAWVFSIFYPQYYGYRKCGNEWFYLVSKKTRHGSPMNIPLLSYPQYCNFEEPDNITEVNMNQYLLNYISNDKH